MPAFIVNMSSMVVRAVIYFLCALELTIERHFCSILEHRPRQRDGVARHRVDREACTPLGAQAGFHQSQSENVQSGKSGDYHENGFRLLRDEMFRRFRAGQKLWPMRYALAWSGAERSNTRPPIPPQRE